MIEPIIDLSRNEFLFDHPVAREDIPRLTAKEICQYTQGSQLLEALSKHHDVNPDCITLFNGAEHALRATFATVSRLQGATLFLPLQGWDYYWKLADDYQIKTVAYDYKENGQTFELDLRSLRQKIKNAERPVLLLDSPSNPLACRIEDNILHELASMVSVKNFTIFDNTYANFCEEGETEASLRDNLKAMPNTVIIRSLSKYYGRIPGLRVGFATAQKEVLKQLSIQKDYLGFNAFSDAFAVCCLHRHKEFQKVAKKLIENRKRLLCFYKLLSGFKPFNSSANFILVRVLDTNYASFLLEQGIKIKSFSEGALEGCVRITTPPLPIVKRIEKATHVFCEDGSIPKN